MATFDIDVVVTNRNAVAGIGQVNTQLSTLDRTVATATRALAGLFALDQLRRFGTALAGAANDFNLLQRSATLAAGPTGLVGSALDDIIGTADRAGVALDDVASTYQRFSNAGRVAGIEQQTIANIVDVTTRGFAVFSNTAGEASSAITQLSQAFSSGRLAGDEFRSVSENFPPLLAAISEVTGVASGELRNFAAEGGITTDVLIAAFGNLEDAVSELEGTVEQTTDQITTRLGNAFILFTGEVAQATGVLALYRAGLEALDNALDISRLTNFGGTVSELEDAIESQTVVVRDAEQGLGALGFALNQVGFDIGGVGVASERLEALQAQLASTLQETGNEALNAATSQIRLADAQTELVDVVGQFNTIQRVSAQEVFNSLTAYEQLRAQLIALEISFIASGSAQEEAARIQGIAAAGVSDFNTVQQLQAQEVFNSIDAFQDLRTELLVLETQYAIAGDASNEFADAQQILVDAINEVNTVQQLQAQEIFNSIDAYEALRAELVQLEADFQALENITASFGDFLNLDTQGFENALANLSTLGLDLGDVFSGAAADIAEALGVTENEVINATSGIFAVLNEFGFDVEEVFGERAAQAIRLFGAVTSEEFQGILATLSGAIDTIGGLFGGGGAAGGGGGGFTGIFESAANAIGGLFGAGGATADVSTAVDGLVGPTQALVGGVDGLTTASNGATTAVDATGAAVATTSTSLASAGVTGAAFGLSLANIAVNGANAETALSGIGAVIGSAFGPVGAAAGAAGGGFLGSLIGTFDARDEAARLRQIGIDIGNEIVAGANISFIDLFEELDTDQAEAVLADLVVQVGTLSDAFNGLERDVPSNLAQINGAVELFALGSASQLEALGNSAGTAADRISEEFGLALIDVLQVFNTLPPGVADTFDQIQANSAEISQILADQFGLSAEQIEAVLQALVGQSEVLFNQLGDASDVVAARLADEFGVSVEAVQELLGRLPPSALENFSSIANNADEIARAIAVSFGLSFDEAQALILRFAEQAGISLSAVGTTSLDVANQIIAGFSGTEQQLTGLFLNIARLGVENFENIRVGADGSFQLIDETAQERLERIVATFGGTEQDIQLILGLLAGNADIAFTDIFTSGAFAFQNISDEGQARLTELLTGLGFTADQIDQLFNGISDSGAGAFAGIEEAGSASLAALLTQFGLSETQIAQILQAVATNGAASFNDIESAGSTVLAALLTQFGLTGDQINAVFTAIATSGDASFSDIEVAGGAAVAAILADFGLTETQITQILQSIAASGETSFADIESAGGAALAALLTDFGLTGNQIEAVFATIAQSGDASFSEIEQTAAVTLAAILTDFGASETQITQILQTIAASGETSFNDIEGAGGEALAALLADFNLTEDQIATIFQQIALGAGSSFSDVENSGGLAGDDLQATFQAVLAFLTQLFGGFQTSAAGSLASVAGAASAAGGSIQSSFSSAANSAASSLSRIQSQARSVAAAVRGAANAGAGAGPVPRAAAGGLITGPVALTGGGAGRAFQNGGVLDGLTSIFGAGGLLSPTNQVGIAGEAGVEAIFPLDRINGRLGVAATLPPELLQAIRGDAAGGRGGTTVVQQSRVILVNGASADEIRSIQDQILDLDASVETRSDAVIADILSEISN